MEFDFSAGAVVLVSPAVCLGFESSTGAVVLVSPAVCLGSGFSTGTVVSSTTVCGCTSNDAIVLHSGEVWAAMGTPRVVVHKEF